MRVLVFCEKREKVGTHTDGEAVKAVCERLPQLNVVSPLALVIEAVDAVDARAPDIRASTHTHTLITHTRAQALRKNTKNTYR